MYRFLLSAQKSSLKHCTLRIASRAPGLIFHEATLYHVQSELQFIIHKCLIYNNLGLFSPGSDGLRWRSSTTRKSSFLVGYSLIDQLSTPEQLVIGDLIILIAAAEALLAKRKSALLPRVRIGFNFKCSKHSQRYFGLVGFLRNFVFIQPFGRLKSNHGRHLVIRLPYMARGWFLPGYGSVPIGSD